MKSLLLGPTTYWYGRIAYLSCISQYKTFSKVHSFTFDKLIFYLTLQEPSLHIQIDFYNDEKKKKNKKQLIKKI